MLSRYGYLDGRLGSRWDHACVLSLSLIPLNCCRVLLLERDFTIALGRSGPVLTSRVTAVPEAPLQFTFCGCVQGANQPYEATSKKELDPDQLSPPFENVVPFKPELATN